MRGLYHYYYYYYYYRYYYYYHPTIDNPFGNTMRGLYYHYYYHYYYYHYHYDYYYYHYCCYHFSCCGLLLGQTAGPQPSRRAASWQAGPLLKCAYIYIYRERERERYISRVIHLPLYLSISLIVFG